jgi:hypothetical protein
MAAARTYVPGWNSSHGALLRLADSSSWLRPEITARAAPYSITSSSDNRSYSGRFTPRPAHGPSSNHADNPVCLHNTGAVDAMWRSQCESLASIVPTPHKLEAGEFRTSSWSEAGSVKGRRVSPSPSTLRQVPRQVALPSGALPGDDPCHMRIVPRDRDSEPLILIGDVQHSCFSFLSHNRSK